MSIATDARTPQVIRYSSLIRTLATLTVVAVAAPVATTAARAQLAVPPNIMKKVEQGKKRRNNDPNLQILDGFRLFTEETFGGNGRTCASCHPATNNFTIDRKFVRGLPDDDPLFVAEQASELGELEQPSLLRRYGLILENLDGFDAPGVMRGVPHTLGLSQSLTPAEDFPLVQATGWSGDGAPGDGSLRSFAIGAVTQHFTRSLRRNGCSLSEFKADPTPCDFRVPTDAELDALLAFQLFLGRDEEVNIDPDDPDALVFDDPAVETGKALFQFAPTITGRTASCAFCHANAGATSILNGANANFATGTNESPDAPACRAPADTVPGDGGFGREPDAQVTRVAAEDFCEHRGAFDLDFIGDMTMNTPSLIEAADTPPYFHNNSADTLEEAVAFYASDAFDNSPSAINGRFDLSEADIDDIAALLRALNILENLRSSREYNDLAVQTAEGDRKRALDFVAMAKADTDDALEVLRGGPIPLFADTNLDRLIRISRKYEQRVLDTGDLSSLRASNRNKDKARAAMLVD